MDAITLDEKFRIEKDAFSWVLIFEEPRIKKNKKTGEEISYLFSDRWYYPDIKHALKKYFNLSINPNKEVIEISNNIQNMYNTIDRLKKTIFNYG